MRNNQDLPNGTEVSVDGYVGTGTIIERIEGGYVVRGLVPSDATEDGYVVNEAPFSQYSVTPVDADTPALGTTYLDRNTGDVYRVRGYSNYSDEPQVTLQYPDGASGSVRRTIASLREFDVIWTSRFLVRGH